MPPQTPALKSYPTGTVRVLLATDLVTPPTRAALQARLEAHAAPPQFFDAHAYATLWAVYARLIPQPERNAPIDLVADIDERLAQGTGNGWRYATLPADGEAYQSGLQALDQSAQSLHGVAFIALNQEQQDAILMLVQNEQAPGELWQTLNARCFFEELLAEVTEGYYSHPLAQEEIGYVGMADARGWDKIGLDEKEAHEPTEATHG